MPLSGNTAEDISCGGAWGFASSYYIGRAGMIGSSEKNKNRKLAKICVREKKNSKFSPST